MKKSCTDYLLWANPKSIANSYEQEFYDSHASLFSIKTSAFNENRSIFDVIKSCIILQGLENRERLNKDYAQFPKEQLEKEAIQDALQQQLPYIEWDMTHILIPTYSKEVNEIYYKKPQLLNTAEYSSLLTNPNVMIVNPFETYGFALLDSPFTRLIELDSQKEDLKAYYHIDFETLFFVRKDLTLEAEFPIFDEKIKNKDPLNLFKHLNIVAQDYFTKDILTAFQDLKKYGLLSSSLYEECMSEEAKYQKRIKKHAL